MDMTEMMQKILELVPIELLVPFLQGWSQMNPDEQTQVLEALAQQAQGGQQQGQPAGSQGGPQDGSGPGIPDRQNLYGA